jgi:hypothetical protein
MGVLLNPELRLSSVAAFVFAVVVYKPLYCGGLGR